MALPPPAVFVLFALGAACVAAAFVGFHLHADGRAALLLASGIGLHVVLARGRGG